MSTERRERRGVQRCGEEEGVHRRGVRVMDLTTSRL